MIIKDTLANNYFCPLLIDKLSTNGIGKCQGSKCAMWQWEKVQVPAKMYPAFRPNTNYVDSNELGHCGLCK